MHGNSITDTGLLVYITPLKHLRTQAVRPDASQLLEFLDDHEHQGCWMEKNVGGVGYNMPVLHGNFEQLSAEEAKRQCAEACFSKGQEVGDHFGKTFLSFSIQGEDKKCYCSETDGKAYAVFPGCTCSITGYPTDANGGDPGTQTVNYINDGTDATAACRAGAPEWGTDSQVTPTCACSPGDDDCTADSLFPMCLYEVYQPPASVQEQLAKTDVFPFQFLLEPDKSCVTDLGTTQTPISNTQPWHWVSDLTAARDQIGLLMKVCLDIGLNTRDEGSTGHSGLFIYISPISGVSHYKVFKKTDQIIYLDCYATDCSATTAYLADDCSIPYADFAGTFQKLNLIFQMKKFV